MLGTSPIGRRGNGFRGAMPFPAAHSCRARATRTTPPFAVHAHRDASDVPVPGTLVAILRQSHSRGVLRCRSMVPEHPAGGSRRSTRRSCCGAAPRAAATGPPSWSEAAPSAIWPCGSVRRRSAPRSGRRDRGRRPRGDPARARSRRGRGVLRCARRRRDRRRGERDAPPAPDRARARPRAGPLSDHDRRPARAVNPAGSRPTLWSST